MKRGLVMLAFLLAITGAAEAKGTRRAPARPSNPLVTRYPAEAVNGFMKGCTKLAGSYKCGCAILKLQARYSYGDFIIFAGRMENGEMPTQVVAVAEDCDQFVASYLAESD